MLLQNKKNVHLVGIGGIGMSAISRILLSRGYRVSGSDIKASNITADLEKIGIKVYIGHRDAYARNRDLVIYSSAVSLDNPEIVFARKHSIPVISRTGALNELVGEKKLIAVTGAHGKTTTTAMIAKILTQANLHPTVALGGEWEELNGNAALGTGEFFLAEADESDGSFLLLRPFYAVITNIDLEHLDYFKSLDRIIRYFHKFAQGTRKAGGIIYNRSDPYVFRMMRRVNGRNISFGVNDTADFWVGDFALKKFGSEFSCYHRQQKLGEVRLNVPGTHNILNCLAAIALTRRIGIKFKLIQDALADFYGVKRRFHIKADCNGMMIIDDYAHHPSEISATIASLKAGDNRRLIAVFQPHRYTRTKLLKDRFARCFDGADRLILTDIYSASEKPIPGINGRTIYNELKMRKFKHVVYLPRNRILGYLMKKIRPGNIVLVMGAGDIVKVADALAEKLKKPGIKNEARQRR